MNRYQELKQYVEDIEVGLALKLDDLATRLEAIENGLTAIEAQLSRQPRIDPHFVAERLGLTLTESRVAAALAEGNTVAGIAEHMGCKVNTIRWHVKMIKRKLTITTQVQLVRLILLLPIGLPRSPDRQMDAGCTQE